ncbi:MAG: hypothetical protein WAV00_03540 [Nocardioides sp.]
MQFDVSVLHERPRYATFDSALAQFEHEVIRRVNAALRGHDPGQVYVELVDSLHARLPGADLDRRNLWAIAETISQGTLTEHSW